MRLEEASGMAAGEPSQRKNHVLLWLFFSAVGFTIKANAAVELHCSVVLTFTFFHSFSCYSLYSMFTTLSLSIRSTTEKKRLSHSGLQGKVQQQLTWPYSLTHGSSCHTWKMWLCNSYLEQSPSNLCLGDFRHKERKFGSTASFHEAASILGGLKPYAVAAILVSYALRGWINHSPTVHAVGKTHLSRREREAQPAAHLTSPVDKNAGVSWTFQTKGRCVLLTRSYLENWNGFNCCSGKL